MMREYLLTCESTADLSAERFAERNIPFVCFTFHMDGADYRDDFGKSMPIGAFYDRMAKGSVSTTSQVSIGEYEVFWRPMLEAGKDVLHLTLSTGISGTYNSACLAAQELMEQYPGSRIEIIDSLNASSGFGLLAELAADGRDRGMDLTELREYILRIRDGVNAWFYTGDLTYLCRGGRVSKTACIFGTALKICPLMRVNREGKLVPYAKCRGKQKVREALVAEMLKRAEGGPDYDGLCYMSQSACRDEAETLAAMIEKAMPKLAGKIRIYDIGTVIGSHTGPGTVAVFFTGKEKEE